MKKNIKIILIAILGLAFVAVFTTPMLTFAQGSTSGGGGSGSTSGGGGSGTIGGGSQGSGSGIIPACAKNSDGCHWPDLIELTNNIIKLIVKLAVVVAPISFAWAGFLILTSGGDEGKLKKGKEILIKVGIGFAVILAAYLLISTIMKTFVKPETEKGGVVNLLKF